MKALIVTPYYHPKIGGLENYARQLGLALAAQEQWDIVVATSNHQKGKSFVDEVDGQKVYRLRTLFKFSNTPLNPFWPFMLRTIIKTEKPDLILAHTPVPSMSDAVALAAGRTPIFLTYHAATLLKGGSAVFNIATRLYAVYERLTLQRANRILVVSDYVRAGLATSLHAKIDVVPNAVWASEAVGRRHQPKATNFVFVGSLDKTHVWKGLDDILIAISLYRQQGTAKPTLTIIGNGNYRQHYEQVAAHLNITDIVNFLGSKVSIEKDEIVSQATAMICYPTTANDAFPTVMLEAWSLGVPVIAAAIGPIPSLINDGVDGYLVQPNNPMSLANVLATVITAGAQQRAKIAAAALARTRLYYTWERQAKKLVAITEAQL